MHRGCRASTSDRISTSTFTWRVWRAPKTPLIVGAAVHFRSYRPFHHFIPSLNESRQNTTYKAERLVVTIPLRAAIYPAADLHRSAESSHDLAVCVAPQTQGSFIHANHVGSPPGGVTSMRRALGGQERYGKWGGRTDAGREATDKMCVFKLRA
jgi:hypothetical protein